ncbi:MAG: nucleotidyltransferase domain-containing protein [Methanobrevibacter sp.]|jgi:predicted nucleotidyltransferase|nr:nucleotidyltransferase domain-containing protein [Candidatus Methanoflexus mossambicus]
MSNKNNRKQIAIDFAKSLNNPEIEKIILFGSVARGEDNINSDIDILILTTNDDDQLKIRDSIYTKVMDILIKTGERVSLKFRSLNDYIKYKDFSFFSNVTKDGIILK